MHHNGHHTLNLHILKYLNKVKSSPAFPNDLKLFNKLSLDPVMLFQKYNLFFHYYFYYSLYIF